MALGALLVYSMFGYGCVVKPASSYQNTTELTVIADWDDIDAAMDAGMSASETAVLARTESDGVVVFEFLSIHDERGKLIATRLEEGTEGVEIRVHAEQSESRANTPQRLVHAFARRLSELRGVETAP